MALLLLLPLDVKDRCQIFREFSPSQRECAVETIVCQEELEEEGKGHGPMIIINAPGLFHWQGSNVDEKIPGKRWLKNKIALSILDLWLDLVSDFFCSLHHRPHLGLSSKAPRMRIKSSPR